MGIVFEARHLVLDQPVAVKIVRREFLHNAEALQSFMDEALALAELRGPSVAQVLDAGIQDGMAFIVMELLHGKDLRTVAHESGPMPVAKAAHWVRQAGLAAAEAHAKGIVHCDLKPENLFLAEGPGGEPHIKVIDFGICTRIGAGANDGGVSDKGSPEYMAPEQLEGDQVVDERADVWALGVVLYELVTGQRPFAGTDVDEIRAAVLHDDPVPMRDLGVAVSESFELLVSTCLKKAPEERFANAARLCEALLRHEGTRPASPRPAVSPRPDAPRVVPWQLSAAALVGTLLLTAGGGWFSHEHAGNRELRPEGNDPVGAERESATQAIELPNGTPVTEPDGDASQHTVIQRARADSGDASAPRERRTKRSDRVNRLEGLDRPATPGESSAAVRAFPDVWAEEPPSARHAFSNPPEKNAKRPAGSKNDESGGEDRDPPVRSRDER
jgi:serine/threonine-protein kinase